MDSPKGYLKFMLRFLCYFKCSAIIWFIGDLYITWKNIRNNVIVYTRFVLAVEN
jgi:hypothetical protein